MKAEGSVKQEHILEAAIKRFSHFGISKTTLAEIADDLSISKPSLFYYFTDKSALITAVAKKMIAEFIESFEAGLVTAPTAEEGLLSLVEIKRKYFQKYFLLAIQGEGVDISRVPSDITEVYHQAKMKILTLVSSILQKGIEQGELKPMDPVKTSNILLDTLSAFEHCIKSNRRVPDINEIDDLFNRQKAVLEIFLNGLKKN